MQLTLSIQMSSQTIIETSSFNPEIGLSNESMTVANAIKIPNSSVTVTVLPQILSPTTSNYLKVISPGFDEIYSSKTANRASTTFTTSPTTTTSTTL